MTKRINAWSSPRNISTAFMYSFAQRQDTTVVDEPLYAHYLVKTETEAQHPGTEEIIASQSTDAQTLIDEVIFGNYTTDIVLFKQMTHHLIHIDRSFLANTENILLIRNPRAIIKSYTKVIPNPLISDIGIKMQYDLYNQLLELGTFRAILDATQLLMNPPLVLKKLCDVFSIRFDENMLSWEVGPKPEDGVWAKYWYANVHKSNGFQPYQHKDIELPKELEPLAKECQPYYDFLFEKAIKV